MRNLPSLDEAIYSIIDRILKHETDPETAEALCLALLVGFKRNDDLVNVAQNSADPAKIVNLINEITQVMALNIKPNT